jgi:hypothetical protein
MIAHTRHAHSTPLLFKAFAVCCLQFVIPRRQGWLSISLAVMGSSVRTNTLLYTHDAPQLTDVAPTRFPTAGGTLLTLRGTNLGVDLDELYNALLASGSSAGGHDHMLSPRGSWTPNEVLLVRDGVQVPCDVMSVSLLATEVHRRLC